VSSDLTARYGAPSPWRRRIAIALGVLVSVVGLGWLLWIAAFHSTPAAKSELIGFKVVSDRETTATLQVTLDGGADSDVEATCRLRALAEDKTAVGELAFTPHHGDNEVTIRTERRATAVEKLGCTAEGQSRPR
jgi:hypothetical protein